MNANVSQFPEDEVPTKRINDAPALMRIRRLAALAGERLDVDPDADAIALARTELKAIEALAAGALS